VYLSFRLHFLYLPPSLAFTLSPFLNLFSCQSFLLCFYISSSPFCHFMYHPLPAIFNNSSTRVMVVLDCDRDTLNKQMQRKHFKIPF
jgi:hypothetical protein